MQQIHSKNTKPEVMVAHYLFSKGLRYRKNDKRYPGHPDIVLPKYKAVIFVNGCFWHMHELRDDKKQSLVTLQNTMRRIIENYFGMLGSSKDLHIEEKFKTAEDRMICKSLLCWINDGSHSIPDDLFIDSYTDLAGKYRDVFKSIFVNTGNEAHYKMMMDADY